MKLKWFTLFIVSLFQLRALAIDQNDFREIDPEFPIGNIKEEKHHFKTDKELQAFWKRFSSKLNYKKIDFKKNDVILYIAGTFGSGGHKVTLDVNSLPIINVILCEPNSDGEGAAVLDSPYDFRVLPKIKGEVTWKVKKVEAPQNGYCK